MTHGEREVYEATGRLSMFCPLLRDQEQNLINQLRKHWQKRFENPKANINSRYFCYEAIYKLRYWRFHYEENICPTPHAIEGISWCSEEGKEICPMCWNPLSFVEYEPRVELVLKSIRYSSSEKRTFLERHLARYKAKCTGEMPMTHESRVHFLRKRLDTFDAEFPQLELF